MIPTLDANLYNQIGLDSGSLTMLGTIVHPITEPGEYRGVVHRGESVEAVFYIKVDKESAAARTDIDLTIISGESSDECKCSSDHHFTVNPRGYIVFHVSKGSGGYFIIVEKAEENSKVKPFDSRDLKEGDLFAATILRPGIYSVTNLHTKSKGEIVVTYPHVGKFVNPPPQPVRITSSRDAHEPKKVIIQPGQGLIFEPKVSSRFKIDLLKADDGPSQSNIPLRDGWRKPNTVKGTTKKRVKST